MAAGAAPAFVSAGSRGSMSPHENHRSDWAAGGSLFDDVVADQRFCNMIKLAGGVNVVDGDAGRNQCEDHFESGSHLLRSRERRVKRLGEALRQWLKKYEDGKHASKLCAPTPTSPPGTGNRSASSPSARCIAQFFCAEMIGEQFFSRVEDVCREYERARTVSGIFSSVDAMERDGRLVDVADKIHKLYETTAGGVGLREIQNIQGAFTFRQFLDTRKAHVDASVGFAVILRMRASCDGRHKNPLKQFFSNEDEWRNRSCFEKILQAARNALRYLQELEDFSYRVAGVPRVCRERLTGVSNFNLSSNVNLTEQAPGKGVRREMKRTKRATKRREKMLSVDAVGQALTESAENTRRVLQAARDERESWRMPPRVPTRSKRGLVLDLTNGCNNDNEGDYSELAAEPGREEVGLRLPLPTQPEDDDEQEVPAQELLPRSDEGNPPHRNHKAHSQQHGRGDSKQEDNAKKITVADQKRQNMVWQRDFMAGILATEHKDKQGEQQAEQMQARDADAKRAERVGGNSTELNCSWGEPSSCTDDYADGYANSWDRNGGRKNANESTPWSWGVQSEKQDQEAN
eukprot:g14399.t1